MRRRAAVVLAGMLLGGCGSRERLAVEDPSGTRDVSRFALRSLRGTRDGEWVRVRAEYGDGSGVLRVEMEFRLTPQARLQSGSWTGPGGGAGIVRERSATFLGGQSGPPSLGGTFDLLDGRGSVVIYRVSIPLQPLSNPL